MKIRNDYVSNSSSSSFILAHTEFFDAFNITKQDIIDALVDAYGRDAYDEVVKNCKKACNDHPDWYSKNLKYEDYGPIYVYDLADANDRSQAIDMWGDLLKDWTSTNTHFDKNGNVMLGAENVRRFEHTVENIAEMYGAHEWDIMSYVRGQTKDFPMKFIRSDEKDPKTGMYGHYETLNANVLEAIKDMAKQVGYMTNLDALKCDLARFFVHADDNDLPMIGPDGEQYESKEYTYDRVCEIVYKYLVKNGRIKPDDPKFMDEMRIDDEYLTRWDKDNGRLWDFANGKNLTYKDISYSTLTQCMHEG